MSVGILFPGQGSQHVGMGGDIFDARPDLLGESADEILGFSLRGLCLDGPEDELTRTEHAQPALFALSYAIWDTMATQAQIEPAGAAGHSLGEYTALAAAGVLDFGAALSLVARRGRAMAQAAELQPSGMAALLGADVFLAEEICDSRQEMGGLLRVANINAPGQIVVAGGADDIAWLVDKGRGLGVRRVIPLKVAGAFHTSLMEPAASDVAEALSSIELAEAAFPVWANTTARPHQTASMKEVLARQVVEPVRFSETLEDMARAGIDTFVHLGPGDVTAGLVKRTVEEATAHVVSSLTDIGVVADVIGTMGGP